MKTKIGERFITKEGYEVVIVEYNNCLDVVVEIQDEYRVRKNVTYNQCRCGSVKNPYHPSIYEHGFLGLMSDGSKPKVNKNGRVTREYSVWHSMLQRVYDPKLHDKFPTYKNCTVCERWHCFANFLEDLPLIEGYELWRDNPNQGIALDKDLKQIGVENKVYSLETVVFIPQSENCKEMAIRTSKSRVGKVGIKPEKVIGVNIKTGEKTKVFHGIREAERETGIHRSSISRCLNGERKSAGKYQWFKVEEKK